MTYLNRRAVAETLRQGGEASGPGHVLQAHQPGHRVFGIAAAHLGRGAQGTAHGWPLGPAEQAAPQLFVQLHTRHPGRLALRHARNGRADRRCDAAGSAVGAAVHEALGCSRSGEKKDSPASWLKRPARTRDPPRRRVGPPWTPQLSREGSRRTMKMWERARSSPAPAPAGEGAGRRSSIGACEQHNPGASACALAESECRPNVVWQWLRGHGCVVMPPEHKM